ncbi:DUF2846 domain-containing protein [Acinetobacter soli]|uniref:DUF2846 domain-containing protein n=1 Tax=Acinetobacter TaxID=469 RepID=UPI0012508EC8|nr:MULTISPECIES: DUF2846 domain-containing protein [Acinetobacter]MDI3379447.1 DUF2846 domain-containing protein [Acinetobacter sp. V89_7]
MRNLCFLLCGVGLLTGCQHSVPQSSDAQALRSTLPPVDVTQKPGITDQYHVGKFSVGGWVNQKLGQYFQPIQPQNPQAAVVYLYRPDTRWNQQEIAAANLFINGKRIPSLLNNHYYWIELPAGTYRLSSSRPLTVFHFQDPKYIDMSVEAGQSYYVKYDEENPGRKERSGPFLIVSEKTGRNQIAFTRLKSSSYNFVAQDQNGKIRSKAQELKPAKYDEKSDVLLVKPFKLWNPLTW